MSDPRAPIHEGIGAVEVFNDLNLLRHKNRNVVSVVNNNTLSDVSLTKENELNKVFDVWHFRLCHPSLTVLNEICNHFPYIKINKKYVCDFCYMAKQAKLPFSDSTTVSLKPFDLIHMDIRGPLNTVSL